MSTISASTTSTTAFKITTDTTGALVFQTGASPTTAVTIDGSQNVGIGTSSPAVKLDVSGRAQFVNSAFNYVLVDSTSSDSYLRLAAAGTVKWYLRNNVSNSNALEITPDAGSSAGLFLSQSGNLGLGVTPSAWGTLVPALQIGAGGSFLSARGTNPEVYLGANTYYNGSSWVYKTSSVATFYSQDTGVHKWYGAPSGTAGANATVTQMMGIALNQTLALQGASSYSGTGISFPATQSASSDANTLDDYEEGAWTPNIGRTGSDPTVTYSYQTGRYVKIGKMVFITGNLNWSALTGGSGLGFLIKGLPFAVSNISTANYSQISIIDQSNITYQASGTYLGAYATTGATYLYLLSGGNGLTSTNITLNSTGVIYFSGCYEAA